MVGVDDEALAAALDVAEDLLPAEAAFRGPVEAELSGHQLQSAALRFADSILDLLHFILLLTFLPPPTHSTNDRR